VILADAIDAVRPSVVQIRAAPPGSALDYNTLGTGFVVAGSRHIITAKHVVDAVPNGMQLNVGFAMPNVLRGPVKVMAGFGAMPATLVDVDAEHDLALLDVPAADGIALSSAGTQSHKPGPVGLDAREMREGVSLAVSGYPLAAPSLVTNAGALASGVTFVPDGARSGYHRRLLGDFTSNPGNSGGPVYRTSDAAVIGVLVAGQLTNVVGGVGMHAAGLSIIVGAEQVIEFMGRQGLTPTAPKRPEASKTPPGKKRRR
jgi:S1-C subfamily serine protease